MNSKNNNDFDKYINNIQEFQPTIQLRNEIRKYFDQDEIKPLLDGFIQNQQEKIDTINDQIFENIQKTFDMLLGLLKFTDKSDHDLLSKALLEIYWKRIKNNNIDSGITLRIKDNEKEVHEYIINLNEGPNYYEKLYRDIEVTNFYEQEIQVIEDGVNYLSIDNSIQDNSEFVDFINNYYSKIFEHSSDIEALSYILFEHKNSKVNSSINSSFIKSIRLNLERYLANFQKSEHENKKQNIYIQTLYKFLYSQLPSTAEICFSSNIDEIFESKILTIDFINNANGASVLPKNFCLGLEEVKFIIPLYRSMSLNMRTDFTIVLSANKK